MGLESPSKMYVCIVLYYMSTIYGNGIENKLCKKADQKVVKKAYWKLHMFWNIKTCPNVINALLYIISNP